MGKTIILWNTGETRTKHIHNEKINLIRDYLKKPQEILFMIIQETHWTDKTDYPTEPLN